MVTWCHWLEPHIGSQADFNPWCIRWIGSNHKLIPLMPVPTVRLPLPLSESLLSVTVDVDRIQIRAALTTKVAVAAVDR